VIGFETQPLGMCFAFLKEADNSNGDDKTGAYQNEEDIENNKSDYAKSKTIFIYTFFPSSILFLINFIVIITN